MAFVPAPNILMVEVRALKQLQRVENRFYVNCLHEPTITDIEAVNAVMVPLLGTAWAPDLPSDVSIQSIFYRSMQSQNAIQLEVSLAPGINGTALGDPGPNQNTFCVSLRSTSAGRSARGRLYWLGLSEDQYQINTLTNAARTAIVENVEALRAGLAAIQRPLTIVSFISNGAPRPGGPVYFVVSSVLSVDAVIDSQRRRMPGRGI